MSYYNTYRQSNNTYNRRFATPRPVNPQVAAQNLELFEMMKPEMLAFLRKKADENVRKGGTFDYPQKMIEAIGRFGGLTDGQREAVERMMAREVEYQARRAQGAQAAVTVDMTLVQAAFDRARASAAEDRDFIRKMRLRAGPITFKPAPAHGKNPGAIYVTEGETYLGKVKDNQFFCSSECTSEQKALVAEVAADPAAAAIAHGQRYKHCSICSRELTNPESRARGIGPICYSRFFGG